MKIVLCTLPIRWQPLTSDHTDPAGLGEYGAFGEVSGTMEKSFRLNQAIPSFTDQYADILPNRTGSCSQTSALPYKAVQTCRGLSKRLLENKPPQGMDRLHLAQKILVQSPHSTQLKKIWSLPLQRSQAALIFTTQQCETLAYTSSIQQAMKIATESMLLPGQYKGFAEQVLWSLILQQPWQNGLAENIKGTLNSNLCKITLWN